MGCSRTTLTPVTYEERMKMAQTPANPATKNTAPKILALENVLVLG
jgi:hypothetical protein